MELRWLWFVVSLLVTSRVVDGKGELPFVLDRLSQTYLPSRYDGNGPKFCLGQATAEQVAYDAKQHVLYIAGFKVLHVVDMDQPTAPVILGRVEVGWEITDVGVCGGLVAVTLPSNVETEKGKVHIFRAYERSKTRRLESTLRLLFDVAVGVLPDHLLFTRNCSRLVVANESTPGKDAEGRMRNPDATLSVIDIEQLLDTDGDTNTSVSTIDFTDWNTRQEDLQSRGVRWSGPRFSQAVEPEYMALSEDQETVYVSLQENNALAVVDLRTKNVKEITSLGLKPFGSKSYGLDASDADNGAKLEKWPVYGLYQPDSIVSFTHKNKEYVVTANEGESAWYDPQTGKLFSDSIFGTSVVHLVDSLPKEVEKALSDPSQLGRLTFSSASADNNTLVAFGSRSVSVFRANDMKLMFDTKDELGTLHAELFPWAFNAENPEVFCADQEAISRDINIDTRNVFKWMEKGQKGPLPPKQPLMDVKKLKHRMTDAKEQLKEYASKERPWEYGLQRPSNALTHFPEDLADATSRASGAAPESLQVAEINDTRLLFVGNEKGNTIFVYDATNPRKLIWHSAVYPGAYDATYAELFVKKRIADIDPEGMTYIAAEDSPIHAPLLVVAGSLSGTVSIYRIARLEASPSDAKPRITTGTRIRTKDPWMSIFVNSKLLF